MRTACHPRALPPAASHSSGTRWCGQALWGPQPMDGHRSLAPERREGRGRRQQPSTHTDTHGMVGVSDGTCNPRRDSTPTHTHILRHHTHTHTHPHTYTHTHILTPTHTSSAPPAITHTHTHTSSATHTILTHTHIHTIPTHTHPLRPSRHPDAAPGGSVGNSPVTVATAAAAVTQQFWFR